MPACSPGAMPRPANLDVMPERPRIRLLLALLLAASTLGCAGTRVSEADASVATLPPESVRSVLAELEARHGTGVWPAGPDLLRTTAADIHLGNIEARIQALASRSDAVALRDLAGMLAYRHRILGRIDDAEVALAHVDAYLVEHPADAGARLLRANLLSGFHRFDEARLDLQGILDIEPAAQRLLDEMDLAGPLAGELVEALQARGHEGEGLFDLALRGNLAVQQGDPLAAERWFRMAQSRYRDVSPMPLAWLHTQQGIAWLRFGDVERAHRFFAAAHARLPEYYLAAEHLAETEALLGRPQEARRLYEAVVSQTDHPEFHAALSEVLREIGDGALADEHAERARAGYASLLARHPAAFADHAAGYYLDQGDHARALQLARLNLESRQGVSAWLLLAEVELASGNRRGACRALRQARRMGLNPPELGELAEALPRC